MSREWHIKKLSREQKMELMKDFQPEKEMEMKVKDE